MKKLSALTIKRLRIIAVKIQETPELYDQNTFMHRSLPGSKDCGTACCIGGWADVLWGKPGDGFSEDRAIKALHLDYTRAYHLFYGAAEGSQSPASRYAAIWDGEVPAPKRAKLAAKRIEWFIKTNGTDVLPKKARATKTKTS